MKEEKITLSEALKNAKYLVYQPSGSEYERGILDILAFSFWRRKGYHLRAHGRSCQTTWMAIRTS